MAEKACHAVDCATQFGLTQALGPGMERIGCVECEGVAIEQAIRTPTELRRVADVVAGEVARGALRQVSTARESGVDQPVLADLFAAPLPDALRMAFRCNHCGERFELRCETYHGSGGRWWVTSSAGA